MRLPGGARVRLPRPEVVVFAVLAAVLRLLIDRRNPPGVTQDSLVYLQLADHAPFGPYSPTRPSGYPLVLRLLDVLPGAQLDVVIAVQHLVGIGMGLLVYALIVRAGAPRWLAAVGAATLLVDAYTLALEQAVLAETMFTASIVASLFLVVRGPPTMRTAAASGLVLGLACTMRTAALFVIPVWLLWLALDDYGRRAVLVGLVGAVAPVLAYCTIHAVEGAGFSLVGADGWYLYANVAPTADCSGADVPPAALPLCAGPKERSYEYYLYDTSSPAYQLIQAGPDADIERIVTPGNNRLLRQFSFAIIRAHPVEFAQEVTKEFFRYLGPAQPQDEGRLYATPGTPLAWYERWVHIQWWMVAGAIAGGTLVLALGRRIREVALLLGVTVALLLAPAATSGFYHRYLVPTFPFLVAIAVLAVNEVRTSARMRRTGLRS